jgi:hypothetical protein
MVRADSSEYFAARSAVQSGHRAGGCASHALYAGAGLLVRTLANLRSINPGFDTHNLLLVEIDLKNNEYTPQQAQNLYRELQSRFGSLLGATNVSYSSRSSAMWNQ